jgi:hypothetical protein
LDFHKDISNVIDGHFTGRENYEKKNLRLKGVKQTDTKCTFTNEIILISKMSRLTLRPTQPTIQWIQQVVDNHSYGTQIAVSDLHILGPLKEYLAEIDLHLTPM